MSRPVPDWVLERMVLGELDEAELARWRPQLDADPSARERLTQLERSNREILERYPAETMAPAITARVEAAEQVARQARLVERPRRFGWLLLAPAAVGAAVLFAMVVPQSGLLSTPEVILLKGDPQLVVHSRNANGQEQLDPTSALVHPGDVLQLSYRAAGALYGAILSIDGRGSVTVHFPDDLRAAALTQEGLVSLSHSYELDDAPGFERFFLVTASEPFSVDELLVAAESLAKRPGGAFTEERLPLPSGLRQSSLLVRKTERP